jgi:hypothetical protein
MYVKLISLVINLAMHGKAAYTNSSSCAQTLNYLKHEAMGEEQEARFFGAGADELSADELQRMIDTNLKGLRAEEARFYSLVLGPSEDELAHIGSDPEKLREYTRQVMDQYAQNFKLKDGQQLRSSELVWGAIIHQQRTHRGTDPEVVAGQARAGEKRTGRQSHVHIIVIARDGQQKISLNPGGRKQRFDLTRWQAAAGRQFEQQFGYVAQAHEKLRSKTRERDTAYDAGRLVKIGERVTRINLLVPAEQRLNPEKVGQIAQSRQFDQTYYRMLSRVEERARDGRPIDNAYHLLATGREQPAPQHAATTALRALQQLVRTSQGRDEQTEHIAEKRGRRSAELDIEM